MVNVINGTYNITQLTKSTNILDIINYANNSVDGLLVGLFITSFFFISLLILKKWEFDKALTASAFTSFIISAFFTYAGLITFYFPLIFLIITSLMGSYLYIIKKN